MSISGPIALSMIDKLWGHVYQGVRADLVRYRMVIPDVGDIKLPQWKRPRKHLSRMVIRQKKLLVRGFRRRVDDGRVRRDMAHRKDARALRYAENFTIEEAVVMRDAFYKRYPETAKVWKAAHESIK